MQEKVNKWIENGCIFSEGVALLASTGKHKQLVKTISGRPHRYAKKLRYELLKYTEGNTGIAASTDAMLASQPLNPSTPQPTKSDQLPPAVELAIKLHADAYNTRAILHEAMAKLPAENTPVSIKKRKEFSDEIAECSLVIDAMHKAKDDYYTNGTIPDMEALTGLKPEEKKADTLPDDVGNLKDLRRRLQNNNSKDQFYLDYQQDTKGKNKNPMPKGPKRTKIELRMKSRLETLELIEIKLNELS